MKRVFILTLGVFIAVLFGCVAKNSPPLPVINTPAASHIVETMTPSGIAPTGVESHTDRDRIVPQLELEQIADGFKQPTYVTGAGDRSGRLFVVEKEGVIQVIRDGIRRDQAFLDIHELVNSSSSEQGLLSMAFHPDYKRNGYFFVNYTNRDGDTTVARYSVTVDPDIADPHSAEIILVIEQPAANHNGGLVLFGPDGYLYIGMGDGGKAGDPWGNAQNLNVLLGKLLRIDVDSMLSYTIPADNPFTTRSAARPEIWAYGLRNPWRFSFDRVNGNLYIADVGQNTYEEVHVQPATSQGGENYGWNMMEGAVCYPEDGACNREGLELPVVVYSHQEGGCSITGGYVYRGSSFPSMLGVYFYADYCRGYIWGLWPMSGEWQSALLLRSEANISSFGEDDAGELYLTDLSKGVLYRLVVTG